MQLARAVLGECARAD